MSDTRAIPIRPVTAATPVAPKPAPEVPSDWRWHRLLWAPHRLGFFLALLVLMLSGVWWALVQWDRAGAGLQLASVVPS